MEEWEQIILKHKTWSFCRTITSKDSTIEHVVGTINWTLLNDRIYQYIETGRFRNIPFSKTYFFDFGKKKVFFEDNRHFYDFPEEMEYTHHCAPDTYIIQTGLDYIQYNVTGPHKNYISRTVFTDNFFVNI